VTSVGATAVGRPTSRRRLACALRVALLGAPLAVGGAASPTPLEVGLISALVPVPGEVDELALPLVVEVAAGEPASASASSFRGEIRVTLRTASGEPRAAFVQPFDLERRGAEGGSLAGLRLYGELRVGAGHYELEATARDLDSGAAGRAVAGFEVPADRSAGWVASPVLFVDRRPGWRALRTSELPASDLPFPFLDASGAVFLPAAGIDVRGGATVSAFALLAAPGRDYPFVAAELVDLADGTARDLPVVVLSLTPATVPGLAVARLELGPVERSGEFRVRLTATGADGTRTSPFASGPALRVAAAAPASLPAASPAIAAGAGAVALEDGYLRVLGRLAQAGPAETARALLAFERAALAPRPSARLADLRSAQRRVVHGLSVLQRPARAAILVLHSEAIALAHEQRDAWLYAQDRSFLTELLRVETGSSARGERAFAADLLALSDSAAALQVDPAHPLALQRQAISLEGTGQLDAAAEVVRRWVAAEPHNPQARLRSAVLERRRGEPAAARETLARLLASPAPDWILELAYAELAAVERALGRPQAARAVLEHGIGRLHSQSLHLQLAFYFDEANQSSRSTAVVHRLPIALEGARPAARHLYALEPSAELEVVRRRVRAHADTAVVPLRAALAMAAQGGR